MSFPALEAVLKSGMCAGCGGCAVYGDIAMEMSAEGYLRPKLFSAASTETKALLEAACPAFGYELEAEPAADVHPLWGPILATRKGYATDAALRHAGSSGGGLSALLAHLLETGAVDGVLQVREAEAPAYANRTVVSRTAEEVLAATGSRYAPSAPLAAIGPHLDGEERLAFVGKPCDVAALRGLAKVDPRVDARFPVMASFFCAGVPSEKGGRAVVAALGVEESELAAFRFRGNGWPGFATATTKDGREASMSYNASWGDILTKHVQARCKMCPDGSGGLADFVCADAWDCDEAGYPIFEERPGQSLIVSRTAKGEAIVAEALAKGAIKAETLQASDIDQMQPGQSYRKRRIAARTWALRLLGRKAPSFKGFFVGKNALDIGVRRNLREFLGALVRGARGRL